ncbi:hypothetical protein B0H66DRAFT_373831 [Apodospora peruviana]|uniref:DUF1857-domain-containing protein n=1 Tax=Apodospora peruviana TaxID=516989 RepID=A0AAE0M012_9PEZI|nr:hypothetical protein B0H66DRAFT_373831 [Apodospora peruviana]
MTVFNLGYTAPINRPGQSPILTSEQVWAGLQRKVRHGDEFVPLIVKCEVESEKRSDEGNVTVTRHVTFRMPGADKDTDPLREVCVEFPPCRVDFLQPDGSKIANYISRGPTLEPEDLFMTYIFEWRKPDIVEGSEEARKQEDEHKRVAVESSIETIRKLVSEGKL